jgi:predicted nucleic acid-binding protein
VVDASVVVDWLLRTETLPDDVLELHAPTAIDYEFQAALRRRVRLGQINSADAGDALEAYFTLVITRHDAEHVYSRMWDMRENISTYDAAYVALAEALDIPLMTTDHGLARAAGPYCQVAPL